MESFNIVKSSNLLCVLRSSKIFSYLVKKLCFTGSVTIYFYDNLDKLISWFANCICITRLQNFESFYVESILHIQHMLTTI